MTATLHANQSLTSINPLVTTPRQAVFFGYTTGLSFDQLFTEHTAWVKLPESSSFASRIARIRHLTSWSFRDLAEVLGTSHTTVGKLVNGGSVSDRSQLAVDNIDPLLDVLERLSQSVPTGRRLAEYLRTPTPTGERMIEVLASGNWARAFLVGLDVLRGPRPKRPRPMPGATRLTATRELI